MVVERMKMSVQAGHRRRQWFGCGQLAGLAVVAALCLNALGEASPAMAGSQGADRYYVLPGGQKLRLVESTSLLGVTLRDGMEADACARRLASTDAAYVLEPVKGAPHARLKLLRVAEGTARQDRLALQDPSIVEVRSVYTFEGSFDPVISTGTIVVKLRPELSDEQREGVWADYGLDIVDVAEGLRQVYCVRPVEEGADEVLLAEQLAGDRRTAWAQPNFRRSITLRQVVPMDEFFDLQWHLLNVGQTGGSINADIRAPQAWVLAEGQDVLIGMFDDGCDVDHEDLAENYIGIGHDPTFESTELPDFEDPRPKRIGDRHGTAVMGLACARGNTVGGRGVAPFARFTVSRGLGDEVLNDFDVALAFTFARQQDVDVHMNAWGSDGRNSAIIVNAIEDAFALGRPLEGDDDVKLGMVIVWASGNDGRLIGPDTDFSILPQVIGVGASTFDDRRASYSNYGPGIDILAPSGANLSGTTGSLVTTDNTDSIVVVEKGYNVGGSELDALGRYTNTFTGTSGACGVAAGVAALVISKNPTLTARNVRIIILHTADQIDPDGAAYDPITSRSATYGYGRLNAERAVVAAAETLVNGGFTWPQRPANVHVDETVIKWLANIGTNEFLVVQSDSEFGFIPEDLTCYDARQAGCASIPLSSLPAGVSVLDVVKCIGTCDLEDEQSTVFAQPATRQYFGLYARNSIGRYSFGVSITSDGVVVDSGPIFVEVPDIGPPDGGGPDDERPSVTIYVSLVEGDSPLTVQFSGNAVSVGAIDDSRTSWDFDTSDGVGVDATSRNVTHLYTVPAGETRIFTARLTMIDVDGFAGFAEVDIHVVGSADTGIGGEVIANDIEIIVGVPGTPGSDLEEGVSPFEVELGLDATSLDGTLQSVLWDLGDGTVATSIVVPHTYVNETDLTLRLAVTATVTTLTQSGSIRTTTANRTITVLPGQDVIPPPAPPDFGPDGGDGTDVLCGALGLLPLLVMMGAIPLVRLRRRSL